MYAFLQESPSPVDPSMFPTWPAKSEMMKRPKKKDVEHSPQAPEGGAMFAKLVSGVEIFLNSKVNIFSVPLAKPF